MEFVLIQKLILELNMTISHCDVSNGSVVPHGLLYMICGQSWKFLGLRQNFGMGHTALFGFPNKYICSPAIQKLLGYYSSPLGKIRYFIFHTLRPSFKFMSENLMKFQSVELDEDFYINRVHLEDQKISSEPHY